MEVANPARQETFVRAELIRRLFDGSRQSRYFSFVLWPVIAAIYWRQVDLTELLPPFMAHLAVTLGFVLLVWRSDQGAYISSTRWLAALALAIIGAIVLTQRLTGPARRLP